MEPRWSKCAGSHECASQPDISCAPLKQIEYAHRAGDRLLLAEMVVLAEALEEKGWRVIFEIVAPVPEYVGRGIFARHEFDKEPAPQPGKETCDAQQGKPVGAVQMMEDNETVNKVDPLSLNPDLRNSKPASKNHV